MTSSNLLTMTMTMTDAEAENLGVCAYSLSGLLGRRDDFETVSGMTDAETAALTLFLRNGDGTVRETGDRYLDAFVLRAALRRRGEFAEIMWDCDRTQYAVVSTKRL